jgi:amidase/6-aminohexanoate-cyclic-dimer hydrolase
MGRCAWSNVAVGTALSVQAKVDAIGPQARRDGRADHLQRREKELEIPGTTYLAGINTVHATGRRIAGFFKNYDMLLSPVLTEPPAVVGRFAPTNPDFFDHRLGKNGLIHYSPFAPIFNITGQPAISLPLHWSADGLPIGSARRRFGDETGLLKLAAQ